MLFDLDGTLIDSNRLHVRAWAEAFEQEGHPVAAEAIAGLIGMGADQLVPEAWPEADEATRRRVADAHDLAFKEHYLSQARPFPGAHDLVARVHGAGIKVVLATSAGEGEVAHYVDLLGIGGFLADQTSIDDVAQSKPSPDIFASALDKADVAAGDAFAIGDSPYDIASAGRAGVRTIALLSGDFPRERLREAAAIYADAADLLAQLEASPLLRG